MSFFTKKELACPCCGQLNIKDNFLKKLNNARYMAGVAFIINSGCRCEKHNEIVGGSKTSSHLSSDIKESCAVDISVTDSRTRYIIIKYLIRAGFNRIGVANSFIHVDDDETKSPEVMWTYE